MSDVYSSTQQVYDAVAVDYALALEQDLLTNTWDRAVLGAFAEYVAGAGGGPVLDVGYGPGRITGHLHGLGLDVAGIDLSPAMVVEAQRRFPRLRFRVGRLDTLDVASESLTGLLAWYSLIHVPPDDRPATLGALTGALRPGGYLQLAFQAGDGHRLVTSAYGHHDLRLDAWRLDPDQVAAQLRDLGLTIVASVCRAPTDAERSTQAYLLARTPPRADP